MNLLSIGIGLYFSFINLSAQKCNTVPLAKANKKRQEEKLKKPRTEEAAESGCIRSVVGSGTVGAGDVQPGKA